MALYCLIKLLLLAAVVVLANAGGSKHSRPRSSAIGDCPKDVNQIIVPMYADKGVRSTNVKIRYPDGDVVNCGTKLPQEKGIYQPAVTYSPCFIPCSYLTIIFIDIDLPPGEVPKLHWMVVNVNRRDIRNGELGNAITTTSYVQPYIDGDRYVFLIYCQKKELTPTQVEELQMYDSKRQEFPVKAVAEKYGLGDPIVGQYLVLEA